MAEEKKEVKKNPVFEITKNGVPLEKKEKVKPTPEEKAAQKKAKEEERAKRLEKKKEEKAAKAEKRKSINEIKQEIKTKEAELKQASKDEKKYKKEVEVNSYNLVKDNYIDTQSLNMYVKHGEIYYDNLKTEDERSKAGFSVNEVCMAMWPRTINVFNPLQLYVEAKNKQVTLEAEIEKLRIDLTTAQMETPAEEEDASAGQEEIPDGTGHLYPIAKVVQWTNDLKAKNKELEQFLKMLDDLDININITWLLKKIEWMCRKINYGLALLRWEILKVLSKVFKQASGYMSAVSSIANFSPGNILGCLGFVKDVVKQYLFPYMTVIQFIIDFMTYTPPLVEEAAKTASLCAQIPFKLLSRIQLVADDENGEAKPLIEVYKKYINVKFEKITIADCMSDPGPKPAMAEFSVNKDLYNLYKTQKDSIVLQIDDAWQEMCTGFKTYKDQKSTATFQTPYILGCFTEEANLDELVYVGGGYKKDMTVREAAPIVYELDKLQKKQDKLHEKAVKAQEKAQALAKRNMTLAAKNILDDSAVQEAVKAQQEADAAALELQQNEQSGKYVATIPWGTDFNASKYEVKDYLSAYGFGKKMAEDDQTNSLFASYVKTYFELVAKGKDNTKRAKECLEFVEFMKKFDVQYPGITTCLDKLKELYEKYNKTTKDMNQLNRRSIFK